MIDAVIDDLKHESIDGLSRVTSTFDGSTVWFECADLQLNPVSEALGSLWLVPCILSGRNLRIQQAVCRTWYENALAIIALLNENWGTTKIELIAETRDPPSAGDNQTAQSVFFSGGVDSLYTLYKSTSTKYLVSAQPFDLPSASDETHQATRDRLAEVARAVGAQAVTIRTNILQHPGYAIHKLMDTHTGLLASLGHLLSQHTGTLKMAPTFHKDDAELLGGHHLLVPLYSSKNLQILLPNAETSRRERLEAISDWHVAQKNLFVCFNKEGKNKNCGRCEKCVRTLLDLHILGKLDAFEVFDKSLPIWESIDCVNQVTWRETYDEALKMPLDPRISAAVRRMLRRERVRVWQLEDAARFRRHVDEEFGTMKEGLENALHHYKLLQANHEKLLRDYRAAAENRPLRKGAKVFRRVMRILGAGDERHAK
ncbi:MAG: hypothetical protein K2Y39_25255 [Candidatus Obscuribacterales bacterium]|nr:hypothetical protein [Candidatus Obscuribacterales bacterium]